MARAKIGVLASGRGTNFQAIADACMRKEIPAEIVLLVCNVPGALVLDRARKAGIAQVVIDHTTFGKDREGWEREAVKALKERGVDLVVFAGFMRLVTPYFVAQFPDRILNIHPSLLPAFPGAHGIRDALDHGAKVSGLTIHFVDASLDAGPIILQKAVPVGDDDTEETFAARILEWENRLYPVAVRLVAEGRVTLEGGRARIDWRGIERPPIP
ncbi:MAG: phosphoribosylglycinamide formyltransferase [Methanobacteriota archaeon]|nr:MAG: phosphoribosylglycinamide formyltransferase [Euryarchaeota archaeon]